MSMESVPIGWSAIQFIFFNVLKLSLWRFFTSLARVAVIFEAPVKEIFFSDFYLGNLLMIRKSTYVCVYGLHLASSHSVCI